MFHSVSITRRWISSKESRLRSHRGGKTIAGTTRRSRRLLALVLFLPSQEAVGQHDDGCLAMKAGPQPALVIIPSQKRFAALVKFLNMPTSMGIFHHLHQGHRLGKVGKVAFPIARLSSGRSLPDEPAQLLPLPLQGAIDPKGDKLLAQPALTPFPPGHRLPGRTRHVLPRHSLGHLTGKECQ